MPICTIVVIVIVVRTFDPDVPGIRDDNARDSKLAKHGLTAQLEDWQHRYV